MVLTSDQIGHIAEGAVDGDLTFPVSTPEERVIFRTTHLGEKHPAVDLLVHVLAPDRTSRGFFFVQVMGTTRAMPASRIPITVPADEFNRLVAFPAPTYLIGVDVRSRDSYIVAAHSRRSTGVASITREFPLRDDAVKLALYAEVVEFWEANRRKPWHTRFRDV